MKTQRRNSIRYRHFGADLTAAVLFMLATVCARAQFETWEVVLPQPDFAPMGYGSSVVLDPYSVSPSPGILMAGQRGSDAALDSVARITPLDVVPQDFLVESLDGLNTRARQVIHNPGDGLYVVGADATGTWNVRRSDDADRGQPGTWQDDDAFFFTWTTGTGKKKTLNQGGSRAMGAAIDADGGLWVAGYAYDAAVNHWIVRYKPLRGSWQSQPRLDIPGSPAPSRREATPVTSISGICYFPGNGKNPTPALLAYGILNSRWTVVRSEDDFASWEVQAWSPDGGTEAQVSDAAVDAQGRIYLCGVHGYDGYNRGWLVRMSNDGGHTWQTLLNQREADNSFAARIMVDTTGTVWVAGGTMASPSPRTAWAVVRNQADQPWQDSSDGSDSWSKRVHPLGPDAWSRGRGMVDDGQGSVYLTGDVFDASGGIQVGLLRWPRPIQYHQSKEQHRESSSL
jgi:hypothetical protein